MRLISAIFLSSMSVLCVFLVIAVLTEGLDVELDLLGGALVMVLITTLSVVILIGVPIHIVLKYFGSRSPLGYVLSGFLVPPALFFLWINFGMDDGLWIVGDALLLGLFGALAGIVFWKVAVRDMPSNTPLERPLR